MDEILKFMALLKHGVLVYDTNTSIIVARITRVRLDNSLGYFVKLENKVAQYNFSLIIYFKG